MTSPDGINWTSRQSAADNSWVSVTYGNGLFVAVSQSGTGNRVMTSSEVTIDMLNSEVNQLFTSVSDGKALVASAITDKGVPTEATDTFQTIADNIANIPEGGRGRFRVDTFKVQRGAPSWGPDNISAQWSFNVSQLLTPGTYEKVLSVSVVPDEYSVGKIRHSGYSIIQSIALGASGWLDEVNNMVQFGPSGIMDEFNGFFDVSATLGNASTNRDLGIVEFGYMAMAGTGSLSLTGTNITFVVSICYLEA